MDSVGKCGVCPLEEEICASVSKMLRGSRRRDPVVLRRHDSNKVVEKSRYCCQASLHLGGDWADGRSIEPVDADAPRTSSACMSPRRCVLCSETKSVRPIQHGLFSKFHGSG